MGVDQLNFRPAFHCENWLGVAHDENHAVFRWVGAPIFFSCCLKGLALSAHFSAEKRAIRYVRQAINEFCDWAFATMPWCRMIFACIERKSVERLVRKCEFSFLEVREDLQIYVRYRKWETS